MTPLVFGMSIALQLENISKYFGPIPALKSVNLEVSAGEIHGLVGENGSGKTTLLNILIGNSVIQESGGYEGSVFLDGKRVEIKSPRRATELGLGMVHQEFALLPDLTVAQNIKMGRENLIPLTRRLLGKNLASIDKKKDSAEACAVLKRLGVDLDARIKTAGLSGNLKQYVELAREIGKNDLRVLILDEPTATLNTEDAGRLMPIINALAVRGTAIIFVSHRLEEVLSICHRVTVLRDGEVVAGFNREDQDFSIDSITLAMVGRKVVEAKRNAKSAPGPVLMQFENFRVDMPGDAIKNFSLQVHQGEILGIAGLSGHGKLALGYGLMGTYPTAGRVLIDGRELEPTRLASMIAGDIYFLTEDRREAGLLLDRSIVENIIFTAAHRKHKFLRFSLGPLSMVDRKSSEEYAQRSVKRFDIRCRNIHQKVRFLSGGNQQKVCLARAVALEPRVLLVAEPTRGVDIGAKQAILEALLDINREKGTTVVWVSSELAEMKQICDRIVVMYEGEVFDEFPPHTPDSEFSLAFAGKRLA